MGAERSPNDTSKTRAYAALILLAGALVWATGIDGVFLYDDFDSITLNRHIRRLWPLGEAMSRPLKDAAETVSTRPFLSLTFAANYAVHGLDTAGYHVVNIAVHVVCALLLFGFLRRTLRLATELRDDAGRADAIACAATLLWLVHPLQTSSVTYIVQRAEALGGLFIVLALYAGVRAATAAKPLGWYATAVAACWIGAGMKETIAAAPILVIIHHATFADGSYRAALAKRWPVYLGMAASWLVLWALLSADTGELVSGGRGRQYALTQPSAILHYLRLVAWPHPLALSYEWPSPRTFGDALYPCLAVGALVVASAVGVARRRWWGFAGACFFAILAPSSSVFELTQRIMEHRMYLPLAAVITSLVLGGDALIRRVLGRDQAGAAKWAARGATAAAALALTAMTVARNRDYAGEIAFWRKNVSVQPTDSVAHLQLGRAYLRANQIAPARESFRHSVRLDPSLAPALNDLARTLIAEGDLGSAQTELERALELDPSLAVAHSNLGLVAERRGDAEAATKRYRRALELDAGLDVARENLARVLEQSGDVDGAAEQLSALQREPTSAGTSTKLAALGALFERGNSLDKAQAAYEQALAADPRNLEAGNALATLLARRGADAEAVRRFEAVLAIDARNIDALRNLGALHAMRGRDADALRVLEDASTAHPSAALVHFNLGLLYEKRGDLEGALTHYRREIEIGPSFAPAHAALARVLEKRGEREKATEHYATALRLAPDLREARDGLSRLGADVRDGS